MVPWFQRKFKPLRHRLFPAGYLLGEVKPIYANLEISPCLDIRAILQQQIHLHWYIPASVHERGCIVQLAHIRILREQNSIYSYDS